MKLIKGLSLLLVALMVYSTISIPNTKAIDYMIDEKDGIAIGSVLYDTDENGNMIERVVNDEDTISEEQALEEYYSKFVGNGSFASYDEKVDDVMIVDENMVLSDTTINKNIYIKKDVTLTTKNNVTINGNVYIFGTLKNTGKLTIKGTLNCLNYGENKVGTYDYGYLINENNQATIQYDNLQVNENYLSKGVPTIYDLITIDEYGKENTVLSFLDYNEAVSKYEAMIKDKKNQGINYAIKSQDVYWKVKYAVVSFKKIKKVNENGYAYVSNTSYSEDGTGTSGYLNAEYSIDAAYLDSNDDKVKFKISGVNAWVKAEYVDIIPYTDKTTYVNYYKVTNGKIYHCIKTSDIKNASYSSTYNVGYAPNYLKASTVYYSYDGHYFYTDYFKMIDDYRNGVSTNAVNKNNPYYNYYQYLPFHSSTNYTKDAFNQFIASKYSAKATNNYSALTKTQSLLFNEGEAFVNGNEIGVNPLLTLGVAINESGWGRSKIAIEKNNLFGLNAIDSNPGQAANTYSTVQECVQVFMQQYITHGYLDTYNDSRYFGGHLGDKASGLNVKYASDPYWGEKAASYSYSIDEYLGKKDYQKYSLGIKETFNDVKVYKKATTSSDVIYTMKNTKSNLKVSYMPVILADTITQNNTNWYKIYTDHALDANQNRITRSNHDLTWLYSQYYNFDQSYGYIQTNTVRKINDAKYVEPEGGTYDIKAFLKKANLSVENGYTYSIQSKTVISTYLSTLAKIDNNVKVEIITNGHENKENYISTDMKLKITTPDNNVYQYIIIVKGDVNCDGKISSMDYVLVKNHILKINTIDGNMSKSADVNQDGKISSMDYVLIKNHILKISEIK